MRSEKNQTAKLFLAKGAALFIGPLADTELQSHHEIQIILSLDDFFEVYPGLCDRKLEFQVCN